MKEMIRVDRGQLAFVRAVIQGISIEQAAQRFLGDCMDKRSAQRELRLILEELATCARRAGAWADAHALKIDLGRLRNPAQSAGSQDVSYKTLEEFRAEVDPFGNYYSEKELMQVYEQQHPDRSTRYAKRVQRLRERQLRALRVAEQVMGRVPSRTDSIASWFDDSFFKQLMAANVVSLSDLLALMQRKGRSWYKMVPGIGVARAARVQDWVARNAPVITGEDWPKEIFMSRDELREALQASSSRITGIVPMERLEIPETLSGRTGSNRLLGMSLPFGDDASAIEAWVNDRGIGNAVTMRQYRREAERLLLWALIERGKPLSSLTEEDLLSYQRFLMRPGEKWINPDRVYRASPQWRPFRQPLNPKNANYSMKVVKALFGWLTAKHYLAVNVCQNLSPLEEVKSGKTLMSFMMK